MGFVPSKYQLAIFDWIAKKQGQNLVVEALAGSGKTTTIAKGLELVSSDEDTIFLAFNKSIATELQSRLPQGKQALTYHALGFKTIRENIGTNIQVDANKEEKIIKRLVNSRFNGYKLIHPTRKLVSLCKNNLIENLSYENLMDIAFYYDIDLGDDPYLIIDLIPDILIQSKHQLNVISFDDMCWLPVIMKMACHKYDFIAVDEVQDTNKAQLELALMHSNEHTRIVGVGDRRQSIYGFRGANIDAIPNLIDRLHADILPLSITYRNPKTVVNLVTIKFPDIPLECPGNARDGQVLDIQEKNFLDIVQPGDMVLCRTNAPIVPYVYALIRAGKKAQIKGKDIGQGLSVLIKKMKEDSLPNLLKSLVKYKDEECYKFMLADKVGLMQHLIDKVDTVIALSDGCKSIEELTTRIDTVFSDQVEGIQFSSIHKAKGLEAKNIYILHRELLPHPMAKKDWQKVQESNLEYVAYTRALEQLGFVI